MSSSYNSRDWVSSHWVHFTVRRLIYLCLSVSIFCVFVSYCVCCIIVITVGWTWWDWSLIVRTYLPSVLWVWNCWLGHLTCKNPFLLWPIMCLWYIKPCSTLNKIVTYSMWILRLELSMVCSHLANRGLCHKYGSMLLHDTSLVILISSY